MHIIRRYLQGYDLLGLDVDCEVQLYVLLLLAVFSLDPASGLLYADASGVDGDGDGFRGFSEASVRA